jgi:hypothetical protein
MIDLLDLLLAVTVSRCTHLLRGWIGLLLPQGFSERLFGLNVLSGRRDDLA